MRVEIGLGFVVSLRPRQVRPDCSKSHSNVAAFEQRWQKNIPGSSWPWLLERPVVPVLREMVLKVGRVAGTLMMLRCNWTSSSETCVPRPKQFGWTTRSPLGWTIVVFIACWLGRWPNMKNSQQEQV